MELADLIPIEIAYGASPSDQCVLKVKVKPNTCVLEAIKQSGLLARYPDLDLDTQKIGVFSRAVTKETTAEPNWRIEIYRPLLIDPKTARRNRAKKA